MSPPKRTHPALRNLKIKISVYSLSKIWISENLDSHLNRYYRKQLNIPVSGKIIHLTLPKSKL